MVMNAVLLVATVLRVSTNDGKNGCRCGRAHHVVVAGDDVAEGRESLLNPLDLDVVGKCVAYVLHLLVCC